MTWWWLPPTRCSHPNTDFLHVLGLEEASDVSLYLQPLQALLEEMEQADYSQVSGMWQNNQAQPVASTVQWQSPRGFRGDTSPRLCHSPRLTRLCSHSCSPLCPRCSALSACSGLTACTTTHLPTYPVSCRRSATSSSAWYSPRASTDPPLSPPAASLGQMWRVQSR